MLIAGEGNFPDTPPDTRIIKILRSLGREYALGKKSKFCLWLYGLYNELLIFTLISLSNCIHQSSNLNTMSDKHWIGE